MKIFVVTLLGLVVAVAAVACGRVEVVEAIASHTSDANEPAALLLSGSALLALGGALRRLG